MRSRDIYIKINCVIFMAVAIAAAAALAARADDANTTLSLRTGDGLIVVEGSPANIDLWRKSLQEMREQPATNRDVLKWLSAEGIPPGATRIYINYSEAAFKQGARRLSWKKTTVGEAVRTGEIPNIRDKELYEAYMLIRTSGDLLFFLKDASEEKGSRVSGFPHTVFVMSSAFANGKDGIFVDGTNISKEDIGYNIAIFDPEGKAVTGSEGFALYNKPEDSARMSDFLNSQPAGSFAAAAVKFGPGVFLSPGDVSALHGYGSNESPDPQVLSSHAMFGKKGWAPGKALEASAVNIGSMIAVFKEDMYIEESRLEGMSGGEGGRIVVLGGTKAGDPVFILE